MSRCIAYTTLDNTEQEAISGQMLVDSFTVNTMRGKTSAKSITLSLRLTGEQAQRYQEVLNRALARNPYADKSDVIREICGLAPPQLLTASEIDYFRGVAPREMIESEVIDLGEIQALAKGLEKLPPTKRKEAWDAAKTFILRKVQQEKKKR